MLHAAIGAFLDTVSEREFDATALALLAAEGFYDVHFIHGAFEFGKDIVAKRLHPETGVLEQYAIQAKAGDIGQPEWRAVRSQLEEAEHNTRAHPHFDATLPRVAVLLTTGRLKGAAPIDAQEFAQTVQRRGIARIEFWDREQLSARLVSNPELAMVSLSEQENLQGLLVSIRSDVIDEPTLERFTRKWTDEVTIGVASLEAAVLVNALRARQRTDLAAMTALHLYRGARIRGGAEPVADHAESARRLFVTLSSSLRDALNPLLDDPAELARVDPGPTGLISNAVTAVRMAELLALAALVADVPEDRVSLSAAVVTLAAIHPGAARPVSDQFAVSLVPVAIVLHRVDPDAGRAYLEAVSKWLLDRSDPALGGLGLGLMEESPREVVERLLGGSSEATHPSRTLTSYVLTVILDLCLAAGYVDLYRDVLADSRTLRVTPDTTAVARGKRETFRRAGGPVQIVPRIEYGPDGPTYPTLPAESGWPPADTILLTATCRSRHYRGALEELLREV